jgi:hypothetical protein
VTVAAALGSAAHAQQASPCPATRTLDDLIHAIDAAVSGPAGKDRACMRQMMLPGARLIPVSKPKDAATYQPHVLTVDDWIDHMKQQGDKTFYEHQLTWKTEVYGHIAHLFSTYELKDTPDGKPLVRGINSIQAINDGESWHIMEIVWEAETPDNPIPQKYLP